MSEKIFASFVIIVLNIKVISAERLVDKNWYVGRVPPLHFEYPYINGYFTPLNAMHICENDLQCGGFTFKGSKEHEDEREIYFFHFVRDDEQSLREYMEYPHWTTFIAGSRNYVMISGHYLQSFGNFINLDIG